jgi:hypothetical protein
VALNDNLIRFVVHSSAENPRSRTVYRPRSEQFVEYLAHASKSREQQKPDRERQAPKNKNERDKTAEHLEAVEQGLRQIERFESRYRRAIDPDGRGIESA